MKKNADALGFDLDSDEDEKGGDHGDKEWAEIVKQNEVKKLKAELGMLLHQPLQKSRKMPGSKKGEKKGGQGEKKGGQRR